MSYYLKFFLAVLTESTKLCKFSLTVAVSTEDVNFAADETVEIKFTWYPSNRSVILFVVLLM